MNEKDLRWRFKQDKELIAGRSVKWMDREKVIKDLDELYRLIYQSNVDGEILGSLHDAVALLKEQEAVKPFVEGRGESFETAETWWYACGNCNEALDVNDKYCRHCGRAVKGQELVLR